MTETRRLLDASTALSLLLRVQSVPHAFYGSVLTAVLANSPQSDEIFCVVEGGQNQPHAFRRVRDALAGNADFTITHSPWTNRLHVTYRRYIPAIEIEILPAGEHGPRHLDQTTVMKMEGLPFLTISEFLRSKLKSWMIRGEDRDAQDIVYVLGRHWTRVDINRIPENDMNFFVARHTSVAPAWAAVRRRYGV
ncbi:hypothetical protein MIND_01221700 [Mycena indigotica]|uniref:Uncharacterized protein n=1 Tax=Mycena indigotica TaxID=2126181 RepID=A0A8H6VU31_9AGAR|nr:uncharacterized protein MIND_01221700 [Mycena indigotica]KAF7291961.1 hypothetical protein MIND_01221700 [Mycena indigotica]